MQTVSRSIAAIAAIVIVAHVDAWTVLADSPAGPPFPPVAETGDYLIEVLPAAPTHSDARSAQDFTKKPSAPCNFSLNGVLVDHRTRGVRVSIETNDSMFTGCRNPDVYTVPIGLLPDTAYGLAVYNEGSLPSTPLFDEDNRLPTSTSR
ncbi:MAG: hypothetical protein U5K56_01340 [Halioglobus sp.]|nr:hypothetical protein [Halioglobus sp.]